MLRVRLDLGYDGSGFHGWADQPGLRTVGGTLAAAVATVLHLEQPAALTVAGRTDSGVHARGQVCHLDVEEGAWAALPGRSSRSPGESLLHRLAGLLPADLVVHGAAVVPDAFDARFSALARRYAYRLADTTHRPPPLRRHDVAWVRGPLDADAMTRAAGPLVGEHDFLAFCRPRPHASTTRTLTHLQCHREPDGLVRVDAEADAFCHHMVRALVGALVAVGAGRRPEEWPASVLAARQRDGAVTVAAAHGLTLEEVRYPPEPLLSEQARMSRRRRDADG